MFRPLTTSHRRPPRRGTSFILIVVVMLSLFSAVGTAYALFAMREARLAMARKGEQGGGTGAPPRAPDPTDTINRFLSTLIYDTGDGVTDTTELTNALRGHGIARSMYGRDLLNPFNTNPWNGVGLFHEDATTYGYPGLTGDRVQFVNYTPMMIGGKPFLLDPEYMGTRPLDNGGNLQPFNPAGRTYVSKAAGYSYPDLKDFFLAAYDPATGEVLAPSFHRPWLFGSLDPTNPNWTNAPGRLFTLRPRPAEHPNFPRVPPNVDGSYTGDVQNLPGGVGPQRNDSIWIDMGLPVVTLAGNRKVKPLVAPLILPLNGLLNASAHGNTYFGGEHGSQYGFGPWEVSLRGLLSAGEANNIVNARGPRQQRSGGNSRAFSPYRSPGLNADSAVLWGWNNDPPTPWGAFSQAVTMPTYPAANSLVGMPNFPSPYLQTDNLPYSNHPSLFNPTEWPGRGTQFPNRIFALSEVKRFNLRYAYTRDWYLQSELATIAPTGLQGTFPFVLATGQTTQNRYRLDPAHANRGLVAPTGYALDRPKVVPQYLNRAGNAALAIPAGAWKPANVSPGAYPSAPFNRSPVSDFPDFTNGTRLFNAWAALGSVNLNRPLADYRANTAQPLSAANLNTTAPNPNFPLLTYPDFDRRKLAHDIFVRLAVATGAAVTVNPAPVDYPQYQYSVQAAPTTPQYDALRYLAQLAVNIVDYVDGDDVSTVFVWNPAAPNVDPNTDPNNFAANQVANRVVFGVERPRLVINEVYGEIVNHPQELETKDLDGMGIPKQPRQPVGGSPAPAAHVRFWLELVNPTNTPANATGPLGNGAATLWQTTVAGGGFSPYQIEIARANRNNTSDATQKGQTWNAQTVSPTNTAGDWALNGGAFFKPDIAFQFTNAVPAVSPNNGQYSPGMARPANGFVLCGPPVTNPKTDEFNPAVDITSSPPQDNAVTPQNSLAYAMPLPTTTAVISSAEYRQHVVLLRRLANPYQPPGPTNPFVTVDVMENVPAFDAVHRENSATRGNSRGQRNSNDGYDPPAERFSIGKVQPYAGQSVLAANFPNSNVGGYNQYQPFPASMVQRQQPNPANMGQPQHTLGRHNGRGNAAAANTFTAGTPPTLSDTIMTPFDWLVHMDRPLVNPLELLQVRDTPPFRVTQQFLVGAGSNPYAPPAGTAPGVGYDTGYPRWIDDGLARALEYLTVRPYTAGVPHGGRVPGQINVNALPDQRVLTGLLDPQGGNLFDQNFVANTAWNVWVATRTQLQTVPLANQAMQVNRTGPPNQTAFEANNFGGNGTFYDRPFMPLGAPVATPGSPLAYGAGTNADGNPTLPSNADLTILRRMSRGSPTQTVGNPPALYALPSTNTYGLPAAKTTGDVPVYPASHPNGPSYFQAEPARKMFNNVTTVNHQFVVFLTIGYFDADTQNPVALAPGITVPRLGAEAYLNVPGDMRQKVIAVVDMSNMALDPVKNVPATVQPFFTSLEATAYGNGTTPAATLSITYSRFDGTNLYVAADGQEVPITGATPTAPGTTLVLGYGVEQQLVQVAAIIPPSMANPVPQVAVTTLNGQAFRTAWGGTCVSNVRPGYPGDATRLGTLGMPFDYNSATYKPVLPYFERLK